MSAEPRWTTPRSDRASYGHECAKIAQLLGWTPMEWQKSWWDLLFEHDAGRLNDRFQADRGLQRRQFVPRRASPRNRGSTVFARERASVQPDGILWSLNAALRGAIARQRHHAGRTSAPVQLISTGTLWNSDHGWDL